MQEKNGTNVKPLQRKNTFTTTSLVALDPHKKSPRAAEFGDKLSGLIVGQERAVRQVSSMYQVYLAGMNNPARPIGILLFLGPTGCGKTRVVEAAAETLFGDSNAIVKIDCAEFQHSHEIAKLIGSPPGYLGHRETSPLLTQENLNRYQSDDTKLTFVLFDEIEKGNNSLQQLLLGIMDKASLTLGDNSRVDFSRTIVVLTSNLGAREMSDLISNHIGFSPVRSNGEAAEIDQKIYRTAKEAVKKRFSPEFVNRIDKIVVFRSLKEQHYSKILDLELIAIQERITGYAGTKFVYECTPSAKEFLLREGIDFKYGARHLKRTIEKQLVYPMSNMVATGQIETGDFVMVDFDQENKKIVFLGSKAAAIIKTETEIDFDIVRSVNTFTLAVNP